MEEKKSIHFCWKKIDFSDRRIVKATIRIPIKLFWLLKKNN